MFMTHVARAPFLVGIAVGAFALESSLAVSGDVANPDGASISLVVNGEAPVVFHGAAGLAGTHVDPQGRWTVTWSYAVDGDPTDTGSVIGSVTFTNTSGATAVFDLIVDLPVCPIILEQSLTGASLMLKVTAGPGGAYLGSVGNSPVFSALADGAGAGTIFAAPFSFGGGGGVMTTSGSFGDPFPSQPAPPIKEAAGTRMLFSMTDGNIAKFTSSFYFGAEPYDLADCDNVLGDLNGDGKVGVQDLILLFAAWGPCAGCAADLNGDGTVGISDLFIMLSNWS